MAEVSLFVCQKKKNPALKLKKFPFIKLSRSTLVFPREARNELAALCTQGSWLVDGNFPDEKLEEANARWLAERRITIELGGERFVSPFLKELATLEAWRAHGVAEEEAREYSARRAHLLSEWDVLSKRLFPTRSVAELGARLAALAEFKPSAAPFAGKRDNLTRTISERFERFREEALALMRRPRELGEIASLMGMSKSSVRRWLKRMERAGLVARTRRRHGVGRPRDVYYRSMHIV
ncbi:MAG: helix-turn-helix domain-containing protein [Candidatus Micrarchaeia archaeon]